MKQGQLKSIFLLFVLFLIGAFMVIALQGVTLNYPSNAWVLTNSISFNFTPNGSVNTIPSCALFANNSGTMALKANYTSVTNGTPHVAGVTINDSNALNVYGWNVTCNNGTDDFGAANVATFGVDGSVPSVTLNSPSSGSYISNLNNTLFKYTPIDTSNPDTCLFYTNLSGTWQSNQTNASYQSGTQIVINLSINANNYTNTNIPDGKYIWNAVCNDTANNSAFASQNFSFIVDSIDPVPIQFLVPSNNTFNNDSTPYIAWNQTTEANFDKYQVLVSSNLTMYNPTETKDISSITTNFTNLSNLATDGAYYVQVAAYDLAGRYVNTTYVLYYTLDRVAPNATLNDPSSNNSYTSDNTPDFNVTLVDANVNSCTLLLTEQGASTFLNNASTTSITNGTEFNLTPYTMADGVYQFNIECNDTVGRRVNATSTYYQISIDTALPTAPFIISTFHQTNSTNKIPTLLWNAVTESNFSKYQIQASYTNNNTVGYEVNITSRTTNFTRLNLSRGYAYTFNVTAYDLAGNTNSSGNTTIETRYYVDDICGLLRFGWNLCGAVWTNAKTLSLIANETGASQVAVFNSSHKFATCNSAVSTTGQHCQNTVNISSPMENNTEGIYTTSINHAVFVYMNSSGEWNNRTWVATQFSSNITLTNASGVGWNIEASFVRNGRVFGHIKDRFVTNVSLFSLPFNNGSSRPYVNNGLFRALNNNTNFDYGRAIWLFYNGTPNIGDYVSNSSAGNSTYDVSGW